MSVITEVESLLTTVSNLYSGDMPATPDNCVCIYNTGGYRKSLSGTEVEEPTFMVKVRHTSYDTGLALCNTIIGLLHGSKTTKMLMIEAQSGILDLGKDESNRFEWSINFRSYYRI